MRKWSSRCGRAPPVRSKTLQLDRVDFADIHAPQLLARSLHKQIGALNGAVPVDQIARALGIEDIRREALDGCEGVLLTDKVRSRGSILVNSGRGPRAARFGIAHELGHFLLERHVLGLGGTFTCTQGDLRETRTARQHKRQEVEANEFAIGLLIPDNLLLPFLKLQPEISAAAPSCESPPARAQTPAPFPASPAPKSPRPARAATTPAPSRCQCRTAPDEWRTPPHPAPPAQAAPASPAPRPPPAKSPATPASAVAALRTKLDISLEAATRCLIERHEEPVAAVWSKDGKIRYAVRGKSFPWIERSSGQPLASISRTEKVLALGKSGTTEMQEVAPAAWTLADIPDLFEDVRIGKDGHALTLLWATFPEASGPEDLED